MINLSNLYPKIRGMQATAFLRQQARRPVIGRGIRWSARMLRRFHQAVLRAAPANVAHDKRQTRILESYQTDRPDSISS